MSHPRLKLPEELVEGGHVSRLQHSSLLVLLPAAPVLGNGSIQNPGQVMARVLQHHLLTLHHCVCFNLLIWHHDSDCYKVDIRLYFQVSGQGWGRG